MSSLKILNLVTFRKALKPGGFGLKKENARLSEEIVAEATFSLDYLAIVKIGGDTHNIGTREEFLHLAIQRPTASDDRVPPRTAGLLAGLSGATLILRYARVLIYSVFWARCSGDKPGADWLSVVK